MTQDQKHYYAFISYNREDKREAKRLQHTLEYYKLPNKLRQENPELPEYVRPVFRDITDLEVGELSAQIHEALYQSHFLIVVCSPRATSSLWVNDEIEYFISIGKQDKIIPYIIEGIPHADNPDEECYPPALLALSKEKELLGANVNEVGKDSAAIRIVSRMFNIRFDTLYQRYLRERNKKRIVRISLIVCILLFCGLWLRENEISNCEKQVFTYSLVSGYTDNFLIPLLIKLEDSDLTYTPYVLIYLSSSYDENKAFVKSKRKYSQYLERNYSIEYTERYKFKMPSRHREFMGYRTKIKDIDCMLYTDDALTTKVFNDAVDYKESKSRSLMTLFLSKSKDEMVKEYSDFFISQSNEKLRKTIPSNPYIHNVYFIRNTDELESLMKIVINQR